MIGACLFPSEADRSVLAALQAAQATQSDLHLILLANLNVNFKEPAVLFHVPGVICGIPCSREKQQILFLSEKTEFHSCSTFQGTSVTFHVPGAKTENSILSAKTECCLHSMFRDPSWKPHHTSVAPQLWNFHNHGTTHTSRVHRGAGFMIVEGATEVQIEDGQHKSFPRTWHKANVKEEKEEVQRKRRPKRL